MANPSNATAPVEGPGLPGEPASGTTDSAIMALTPLNVNTMLDAALAYAGHGLAVFPCSRDKKPKLLGGFKVATTDLDKIRGWWGRWPDASIGLPTGRGVGWVLDVDQPDGPATLADLETKHGPLPVTLEQKTGGDGRQLFFRWPTDREVRNSASKIGAGLDVRGAGGYIIAPPSGHPSGGKYTWTNDAPMAEAPEWLLDLVCPSPRAETPRSEPRTPTRHGATSAYGKAALHAEVQKVIYSPAGTRNHTLNASAHALGQLVAGGELSGPEAESALMAAAESAGVPEAEARKTLKSGMISGLKSPRSAPAVVVPDVAIIRPPVKHREVDNSLNSLNSPGGENKSDEWEPLLRAWPKLSREALPGLAGEFVGLATKDSEADPAAVLATFLVRFGIEASGRSPGQGPRLWVGETCHYPQMFAAIVGSSSKARKGTSAGPVKALFTVTDQEGYTPAATSNGPLSTGEGLAFAVRDERKEWTIDRKTQTGSWVVVDPGVTDKRLVVQDEELAAGLACTKREGNTLSTAIRCFWDSGDYSPLTKRERTTATGAHIGLVAHITQAELAAMLDDVQSLNGFGNRFLWVCARRQKEVPFPTRLPDGEMSRLRREVTRLTTLAQSRGVIELDASAKALWQDVYSELSQDHPGLAGCIINRAEAQALRLAMIYAMLDGASAIGEQHLRAGLAFWDYCKQSAQYVFGGRVASDPTEDKSVAALKGGPLTTTELHRAMGNHSTRDRLATALQALLAAGRITQDEERTGGKTRKKFSLGEKSEFSEFTSQPAGVGEDNSLNSHNSQGAGEKTTLWDGPSEVTI